VNTQDSKAEIFDVFLCHNSADKPVVREIAQELSKENIKPWMDEADIRAGSFWHADLGEQIETAKSAAVFVGESGVGPWQNREIIALLKQLDKRQCPVIPVVLSSAKITQDLPWYLESLHSVDFRTVSHPLKRLIWGITGQKPREIFDVLCSEKPGTIRQTTKSQLIPSREEQTASHKVTSGRRLYPALAKPPDPDNTTQLNILRERVMEYWVDGVLKHSLYNEVLISLGKREVGNAVDAPWKYTIEVSDATNSTPLDSRDLRVIYDATGLLLILGEPGSGKTTTMLDLARTLLERARDDIRERVPVVVNLSSWKKKEPLAKWISNELSEKYRVPRKIGHLWLERGYLLPLLDGLDEIDTVMQPDCVAAINAFIEEFQPCGLVVCCRLNEYRWLPKRLKLNGAICIEPLSSEEVSKYLDAGGPELAALREAVDADPVVRELSQTPLMLSIMSLAYQGVGRVELAAQSGDSLNERRKQIFNLYVEQMFRRKGTASLVFPKEKIIGWLSWLAAKMREHSQSIFFLEGLQPSWLGATAERAGYGTAVGLSHGVTVGLIVGLIGELRGGSYGLNDRLIVGLFCGLIGGPIGGLIGVLGVGPLKHITSVETMNWKWDQFWKRTIRGSFFGLITGVLVGLQGGLIGILIGVLIGGLIFGLLSGLIGGFTDRVKVGKASPNQGIKLSLKNSLAVLLVTWLVFGLIGDLILGMNGGLILGLILGLIAGANRGGSAVIKHYALRLILWLSGYTPFNYVRYLDQCAKLIFMKKVGGGYIFIHRMLLDYFADLPQSTKGGDGKSESQS
jgi:hypothetical protein